MRLTRLIPLALIALLAVPLASCGGGDGGSPTASTGTGGTTGEAGTSVGTGTQDEGVQITLVSGDGQTGAPGEPLPQPIVVRVLDQNGRPRMDATVNFVTTGNNNGSASPSQASTDTAGYARTTWTLGDAGPQELRVSGTGGTFVVTANAVARVARVEVMPDSLILNVGATGDFDAFAYDSAGNPLSGRAVAWSSADSTVARVGADGGVTAVARGSARITATVGGVSGSAIVRVTSVAPPGPRVARVDVVPDSLVLNVGGTGDFDAVARDSAGNVLTGRGVAWSTADSLVITLGPGGEVRALAAGTATVRATVEGVTGTAIVRVRAPQAGVARVVVSPDSVLLRLGETAQLVATAYNAAGNVLTGRPVAWASADSTVAIAGSGGTATAVGYGSTRITAWVEGVSGSAAVIVAPPPPAKVARVKVIPDSLVLEVGQAGDFDAVAYDSANKVLSGRGVVWSTADSAIVRLGSDGSITARAAGTARITATVEGVSASATVRVWLRGPPKVARVLVIPDSLVMEIGDTAYVRVFAYDSTGAYLTGRLATLASTATAIATVDAGGIVIARGSGSARITATVEGVVGSASVRVKDRPAGTVTRVNIVPDSLILYVSESRDIRAVAYDRDGVVLTGRRVYWSSTDPSVAHIYEGNATGLKAGFARLTATVDGVSYSIKVEVRGPGPQPYPSDRPVMWIQKRVVYPTVGPDYGLIDVTDYERTVQFTVELKNAASSISMRVRGPNGQTESCVNPGRAESWREFSCTVYLPKGSEPGAWQVDQLRVDAVTYSSADLAAMRAPGRVFDVYRRGVDTAPPQVRGIWPHGWSYGAYHIKVGVVDHTSGVHTMVMIMRGPAGQTVSCNGKPSSGDLARSGEWGCILNAPANSGTWTVVSITTSDGAGNSATYTPSQIEPVRDAFEYTWLTYEFFP